MLPQIERQKVSEFLANASFTVLAWVGLYGLNARLSEGLTLNDYVSWLFLPAAVRIVAVLLAGYAGVAGLFVGAVLTNLASEIVAIPHVVMLSALSALSPLLAVRVVVSWLGLGRDLAGLHWWHLAALALVGAMCNVSSTQIYLTVSGSLANVANSWAPMLVGDLIGTAAVLYLASLGAKLAKRIN